MTEYSIQQPVIVALYRCPIKDAEKLREKIHILFREGGWIVWEEDGSTQLEFTLRRAQRDAYIGRPEPGLQAPPKIERDIIQSVPFDKNKEEILRVWLSRTEEGHTVEIEYHPLPYYVYRRGRYLLDIKLLSDQASDVLKAMFLGKLKSEELDPYIQ